MSNMKYNYKKQSTPINHPKKGKTIASSSNEALVPS